jgi:hypothetical protein
VKLTLHGPIAPAFPLLASSRLISLFFQVLQKPSPELLYWHGIRIKFITGKKCGIVGTPRRNRKWGNCRETRINDSLPKPMLGLRYKPDYAPQFKTLLPAAGPAIKPVDNAALKVRQLAKLAVPGGGKAEQEDEAKLLRYWVAVLGSQSVLKQRRWQRIFAKDQSNAGKKN